MKKYLIDTHIFLWWLIGDNQLNNSILHILQNPQNQIFVSAASLWEISIKHTIGKLSLKTSLSEMMSVSEFELLSITGSHVLELEKLPLLHNDPFDRMLIAQTKAENLILITVDAKMKKYAITYYK